MVALAQVLTWIALCGAPCQVIDVDLPAGTLFDQLNSVATPHHFFWLFNYPEVNPHFEVPALKGRFTIKEALDRIVEHTPYTYEINMASNGHAYFVVWPMSTCGVPRRTGQFPTPPCIRLVRQ